jgi:hypothetical protein
MEGGRKVRKLYPILVLGVAVGIVCWAFGPGLINAKGKEAKVKVEELPEAVKATVDKFIRDEAPGAKIDEAKKEVEDGKVIYDIELEAGDKDIELEIAEDGTLLEKEVAVDDEDEGVSGKDDDEGEGDDDDDDDDDE